MSTSSVLHKTIHIPWQKIAIGLPAVCMIGLFSYRSYLMIDGYVVPAVQWIVGLLT